MRNIGAVLSHGTLSGDLGNSHPSSSMAQECHEEYEVVVDTRYTEECQDHVTTQCHQVTQKVLRAEIISNI